MFVIDTNIFLRFFTLDDKVKSIDCYRLIELIESKQVRCVVPGVVLQEVAWTLKTFYKIEKKSIIDALERITSLSGVKINDNYDYALAISFFKQKNVKFVDCLIASLCIGDLSESAVISYDKDFDKLGITRKEPSEILED